MNIKTVNKTVKYDDGTLEYFEDDLLHNEDGPAVLSKNGSKFWYERGMMHRTDGPAMKTFDGITKFFVLGQELTKEEFRKAYGNNLKTLEITISGSAGTGKTTLANYITNHLNTIGLLCSNTDIDVTDDVLSIDNLDKNLSIVVNTEMTIRRSL